LAGADVIWERKVNGVLNLSWKQRRYAAHLTKKACQKLHTPNTLAMDVVVLLLAATNDSGFKAISRPDHLHACEKFLG
jgi:hypothetical protein